MKVSEMKVSKVLRTGFAVAGLLAAGVAATAQGPGGGPGQGFGPGFGQHRPPMEDALGSHGSQGRWWNDAAIIERLKLTDDQRKQMDGIMLQHRESLIDMRANVEKAELGMEPLMSDDQPNEAKILGQIDKVAQARAELEKANARFLLAIRGKLTPEQWKALRAARSEHMQRHGWQDGQRQGKPGGDRQGHRGPDRQGPPPPDGGSPAPGASPAPGPQGMIDDEPAPESAVISPTASDQ